MFFALFLNAKGQLPFDVYGGLNIAGTSTSDFTKFDISDWEKFSLKSVNPSSSEEYLPLLVGSRYYFTSGNVKPSVTAKLGYTIWKSKASSYLTLAEESGSSLSCSIGAGLKYSLNTNFYAIANIDYNVVNSEGNINFTTVRAGIGYTLL